MVKWSGPAKKDLRQIYSYIAKDSKYYAKNVTQNMVAKTEKLKDFPEIEKFELNLFTFRAQLIPNFHCLRKSDIDIKTPTEISFLVFNKDKQSLIDLLKTKMHFDESIICIEGLKNLSDALKISKNNNNNEELAIKIDDIIKDMLDLKKLREKTSIYELIKPKSDPIRNKLIKIIEEIGED